MSNRTDDWPDLDEIGEIGGIDEDDDIDLNEKEIRTEIFKRKQKGDSEHQVEERVPNSFKLRKYSNRVSSSRHMHDDMNDVAWDDDFSDICDIWNLPIDLEK